MITLTKAEFDQVFESLRRAAGQTYSLEELPDIESAQAQALDVIEAALDRAPLGDIEIPQDTFELVQRALTVAQDYTCDDVVELVVAQSKAYKALRAIKERTADRPESDPPSEASPTS